MATAKAVKAAAPAHSLSKRAAYAAGEAVDGHTDIAVGWRTARHPALVEVRAIAHQIDIDSYLAEKMAEYA